jgi:SET domain-containing protein
MYKPLPKSLTIGPSNIEGLGLFAVEPLFKGKSLGKSLIDTVWNGLIRTPLGGFYNHSDEPNCEKVKYNFEDGMNICCICYYELVPIRDIKAGEELTVKYTLYDIG